MKLTKKMIQEINNKIANLNTVLCDTEEGPIYWGFQKGEFVAGGACNSGILPEFSHEYDPTESFHTNLENFVAKAQEHFNI